MKEKDIDYEALKAYCNMQEGENITVTSDLLDLLNAIKDAEEAGLLVRLPCKVGDKMFYVNKYSEPPRIEEFKVSKIVVNSTEDFELHVIWDSKDEFFFYSHTTDHVYVTRPEAEKRLKELKENRK